jgi:predicted  nucleic acid-binding Zn-ribbon protein
MSLPPHSFAKTRGPKGLDRLLELQELDLSIDRLHSRHATLEAGEDLRTARERLGEAEARLGELRLQISEVAVAQRRLENDVDSMSQKLEAERKRLYDGSVANVRELQSIEHEVENIVKRRTRMEDELLERMEQREELDSKLPAVEADVAETRARVAEIEEGSGRELVEIERALEARAREREALLPAFDQELLQLYEDLRPQKKGVAAAALEDGICGGCHQKLSPVYLDRMKRDEGVKRCEYCRRILVPA